MEEYGGRLERRLVCSVVVGATRDALSIWDGKTGELRKTIENNHAADVVVAPDGKRFVFGSSVGALVDAESGTVLARLPEHSHFGFSPDGRWLVVGAEKSASVLQASDGKRVATLKPAIVEDATRMDELAWAADSKHVVVDWDSPAGCAVYSLPDGRQHASADFSPDALAFAGDGSSVVLLGKHHLRWFSLPDGRSMGTQDVKAEGVVFPPGADTPVLLGSAADVRPRGGLVYRQLPKFDRVRLTKDGKYLLADEPQRGDYYGGTEAQVYAADSLERLTAPPRPTIHLARFTPNGIVTDLPVTVWELDPLRVRAACSLGHVSELAVFGGGSALAVTSSSTRVEVADLTDGACKVGDPVGTGNIGDGFLAGLAGADDVILPSPSDGGERQLFELASGRRGAEVPNGSLYPSHDGKLLAVATDGAIHGVTIDGVQWSFTAFEPEAYAMRVSFSPDDRRIAALNDSGRMHVLEIDDKRQSVVHRVDAGELGSSKLLAAPAHVLVQLGEGPLTVIATGGEGAASTTIDVTGVEAFALMPGGDSFAVAELGDQACDDDGCFPRIRVRILELSTGRQLDVLKTPLPYAGDITIDDEGRRLAVYGNGLYVVAIPKRLR